MKPSDTYTIGRDTPLAFQIIMVPANGSTILFFFKHPRTGYALRQALEQEDLRIHLVPPESP